MSGEGAKPCSSCQGLKPVAIDLGPVGAVEDGGRDRVLGEGRACCSTDGAHARSAPDINEASERTDH